jgi:hypothetical protein
MRDVAWRVVVTLTVLAGLMFVTSNVSCTTANHLVESVLGQTPRAQILAYLDAVAGGDRQAALALWPLPGSLNKAPDGNLAARRQAVTGELLAYGPDLAYEVLDAEWWRTCCEPGVIAVSAGTAGDVPANAGGARIRVAVESITRPRAVYVFDVLVPGSYWGDAMGNPVREWAIVDVYPQGAAPLAWTWE